MDVSTLYEGQVVKNYKELCNILKEPIVSGNSKQCQIKNFERYFSYRRDKQRYIIEQIYNHPKQRIDKRKEHGNHCKKFTQFCVDKSIEHRGGVYSIKLDNDIYIGSTNDFRKRFLQHYRGNPHIEHTFDMLKHGATFSVEYLAPICMSRDDLYRIEDKYIKKYINSLEYCLVNPVHYVTHNPDIRKTKYKSIRLKVTKDEYSNLLTILNENGFGNAICI